MNDAAAEIHCDACGTALAVEKRSQVVACECGHRYAVTVTRITGQGYGPDRRRWGTGLRELREQEEG